LANFDYLGGNHNRVDIAGKNSIRIVAFCDNLEKNIEYFINVSVNHVWNEDLQ